MKQEKISSLLKKRKGHTVECFLFVVLFLGTFLSLGATAYRQHLKAQCDTYYGAWDGVVYRADAELYDVLQEHAAVEAIGRMDLCGYVLDSGLTVYGSMGYVDSSFLEMGSVELESGRFPEKDNEIAVEASVLLKLGYEKKLGQEIELEVAKTVKYGKTGADPEESNVVSKRFYVTGIVNNYSAYWQDDGEWPVSFFLWKNPAGDLPVFQSNLYLSLKPEFSRYLKALETVCSNRGRWQKNGYRYKGTVYAINTYVNLHKAYHLFLFGLLILVGVTFLFYVLGRELWKNRELYRCLFFLGLGKKEFFRLCFQSKWKRVIQFAFTGYLAGTVASVLFHVLIHPYGEVSLLEQLDGKTILLHLLLVLGGTLVLSTFVVLIDFFIIMSDSGLEKRRRKRYQKKKPFSIPRYFRSLMGIQRRVTGLLFCGIALILLFCSNTSWIFLRDYRYNLKSYPYDYIFGGHVNYNRDPYTISKKELSEICSIRGITEIHCFSINAYEIVSYGNRNLSSFENYSDQNGNPPKNSTLSGSEKKTIMGISDGLLDTYVKDLELDEELFRAGGVILYVPDLYLLSSGQMGSELWMKSNFIYTDTCVQKYRDDIIKTGDTIRVDLGDEEVNLKVAGIFRTLEENTPRFMITMVPYSIICSYEVYEELFGEEIGYSCVMINTDDDNSFQTDLELSKTSAGYRFQNFKSQRNRMAVEFIVFLILFIFLIEVVVFFFLLLGGKNRDWKRKTVYNQILQLHILGMTIREMKREMGRWSGLKIAADILLADGIFMAIQGIINLMGYGECLDNSSKLYEYLWDYVCSNTLSNTNFPLMIMVSLLLFVLFYALQQWNMHRMLKEIIKRYE